MAALRTDPDRPRGEEERGGAVGVGRKSQKQTEMSGAGTPGDTPSAAGESGTHTRMQTHPTLFQVSMADLCLVPQVANAER